MAWRKRRASASRRRAFVTHSICRFFADLAAKRDRFLDCVKLESFPFEESFISVKNSGVFPDLILRAMRSDGGVFCGGELIEIKDSKSGYLVASFNSTLPSGKKRIGDLPSGLARRMVAAGDPGDSLPERDVYYLLRGKRKGKIKVCLVHGSFFETVDIEENIRRSFGQAIDEAARENEWDFSPELREKLLAVIARQKYFNSVRKVGDASVNLRFRLMADANPTGNLLNPKNIRKSATTRLICCCRCTSRRTRRISPAPPSKFSNPSDLRGFRKSKSSIRLTDGFCVFKPRCEISRGRRRLAFATARAADFDRFFRACSQRLSRPSRRRRRDLWSVLMTCFCSRRPPRKSAWR